MGYLRNRGTKQRPEWYIRFKDLDGKWKQRHSHQPTKEAARTVLTDAEAKVKRGLQGMVDPTAEDLARRAITVGDLVQRFLGGMPGQPGYAPPRLKDLTRYRADARKNLITRVPTELAARPAASIRLQDIEALRDAMLARGLAGASVVQVLASLSKLFNWARKSGLIDCPNPVQGIERPRTSQSLDYLDAAETGRLLALAEAEATRPGATWEAQTRWPMVATAVYAGLRKGELFGLRWPDVALDAGRLDVLRSYRLLPKNGKPRHVPINPELGRILRWWKERCPSTDDAVVFPVQVSTARRMGTEEDMLGIADLLARAGCHAPADGHPWHMLRHTFASHFVMAGGGLLTLQRLLGHSTPTMTMRYAHLAPDYLAAEVARMTFARPTPAGVANLNEARRKRAADQTE